MSADFKMGFIGVGHMGQYHVNVVSQLPTHKISGVFDADPDRCKLIADRFNVSCSESINELLENSDAITIGVPTRLHYEIAKKALEKGCHILIEKPITETIAQAEEIINLAAKKNLILQVGHVERFNGAVLELQKIVTKPLLIETKRLSPFSTRISDVGVVLDLLIHDLDIVLNLVKSPLKEYNAFGKSVKTSFEDIAVINLLFENGTIATLTASRVSQVKDRTLIAMQENSHVKLNYANQDIEIHRQASSANLTTPDEIRYSQESFVENLYVHKDNPLKSEQIHFYNCITQGTKPIVSNEKDMETLKIALGSIEQIRKQIC